MHRYSTTLIISIFAVCGMPLFAHAHASPVEYQPRSSVEIAEAPEEIRIRFSERVERGASRIVVADESGARVSSDDAVVDPENPHYLSVPLQEGGAGTYFVSWSVVSSDDGHFTKGEYAYFVGTAGSEGVPTVPQVEIVQLSALPEASAIATELLGNSILWGALLLFALVLRTFLRDAREAEKRAIWRVYRISIFVGVSLVFLGAGAHIVLKTLELASLHSIAAREALPLYLATVSGSATIVRALVALLLGAIFFVRPNAIRSSIRITWSEAALFILLIIFAYFRAKVSHATANPFHPPLSVVINLLHLVGKDSWAGIVAVLSALTLSGTLRPVVSRIFPRTLALIAIAFGITSVSACYIVWLHLRDFSNLSTTLWGERFIPLLVAGFLAVLLLVYHVVANRWRARAVSAFLPYTLAAECAMGVLIVFFSSLAIITSPPVESVRGEVFEAESNGLTIVLERAPYEDGMALLTISGAEATADPLVVIGEGDGGLVLELEHRFDGGHVFPLSVLAPGSMHRVNVTVSQDGAYDGVASFSIDRTDLDPPPREGHGRRFDLFTLVFIACAIASILTAVALYRLASDARLEPGKNYSLVRYGAGFLGALIVAAQCIGLGVLLFANDYKKECVADGNGWHIMLPSKNGAPVSETPREGCMALGTSFHLPDAREYRFLKKSGETRVEFANDLTSFAAGKPVVLDFRILDEDNNPALLSVQHERMVHFIVVSGDMREFYHLHPDDSAPLSAASIRDAHFEIPFTFTRGGEYILALDYAHGLTLESTFVRIRVSGGPPQEASADIYPGEGEFDGYDIAIDYSQPLAGEIANLVYEVGMGGKRVTNLEPYLGAAMHIAVVKNDLTEFVHTHGEVHPPGTPVVPPTKSTVHQHTPPPRRFSSPIDAHPIFPSTGLYTVFGQFMHEGEVVLSRFTVRVN